jgi:hypothetical protein
MGWCGSHLCSVIFEIRHDPEGEFYHLVTAWPPRSKSKAMPKASKKIPNADEIAEIASRGGDISMYFSNKFTVVRPVRRVNVDLTQGMLRELDKRTARLNISRQAIIKTLPGRALNEEREHRARPRNKCARRPLVLNPWKSTCPTENCPASSLAEFS